MIDRALRKFRAVYQYPALAYSKRDRWELWLLGLSRNRIIAPGFASRFTRSRSRWITPRLHSTRGEHVRLELDHRSQIDCFDELFLEKIYDVGAVPFSPDLVADCGAFCGYFSALAAGHFPESTLTCFEANPDNIPLLQAQIAQLSRQVEVFPFAVLAFDGTVIFKGTGLGGSVCAASTCTDDRTIPCLNFKRWLRERSPQRLVWKVDIEGAERELLPVMLPDLPRQTVCFLETHFSDDVCRTLLDTYRSAGFAIREVRRRTAATGQFDYVEWLLIRV